jgi:signal recognition particle subunit SRP54
MDLGKGIRSALSKITGAKLVDEKAVDALCKDLQRALITNDVNVRLVFELSKRIKERALEEKRLPGLSLREHVVRVVYDELEKVMGSEAFEPRLGKQRILLCGLFGQGKTTTVGKLAKYYSGKGLSAGVIAGDVHRPAALEQLRQVAEKSGAKFYGEPGKKDVNGIIANGLKELDTDVVILDSAGRSAFDEELVEELKGAVKSFEPDESFLVVSADMGQVAGKQAQAFKQAVPLTGVIISKMDGSGKGGGALSSVAVSGARIAFIGTGEKTGDLEAFDPESFVGSLVGYADLKSLLEKAREVSDEEELQKAMESGKLDYSSFLAQMRAMKKMGPMKQILQMIGVYDVPEEVVGQSEEKLKQFEAAVLSMTPGERSAPPLMKQSSRQERVAAGSGLKKEEVKELVKNFERTSKMMKKFGKNRGLMKRLGKNFPGLSGLK